MSWSVLEALRSRPDEVRRMLKWRGYDEGLVDEFLRLDNEWKSIKANVDELRHRRNMLSSQISKAPPEARQSLIGEANRVLEELKRAEAKLKEVEDARGGLLRRFPNLIHESVYQACGREDADEVALMYYGRPKVWAGMLNEASQRLSGVEYDVIAWEPVGHADMLEKVIKLGDTAKASEVAGSRFFYLFDDIAWLNLALSLYAIDYLTQRGFRLVLPPHMLNYEAITSVIDFEALKDAIYTVDNELYLIGTAEHPLAALYRGEELLERDLPILLAGFSPSYRREAGAGNRDLKGIFRVHQFYKVEQFVFSLPEESWRWHEELLKNLVEIWKGLEIPFRVVLVCPREMSRTAAKQYDLEAWMPAQGMFREMASCSNVTDWQSYRLGIRVVRKGMRREYVHTLNSTAIAVERTITAILENNQEEDGTVKIPKVLNKYLEAFPKAPRDYIHPKAKVVRDSNGKVIDIKPLS